MYELNAQEIDLVAGGNLASSLSGLLGSVVNNVVGAAETAAILAPAATGYNAAATLLNSVSDALATLGTGNVIGAVGGAATGVVNTVGNGATTAVSTAGQIPAGAAGASNLTNAINTAVFFNSLTTPFLNTINV